MENLGSSAPIMASASIVISGWGLRNRFRRIVRLATKKKRNRQQHPNNYHTGHSMKGINRRHFLKWMGAITGSTLLTHPTVQAASNKEFPGYPGSMGVLHDISKCIGCRKCEAACNEINKMPRPDQPFDDLTVLSHTRRTDAKTYTIVNRFEPPGYSLPIFVKKQCNHCKEPACVSACFVKALKKNESGAVVYDESLCVGCRYCMIACPFEIPAYEYNNPFSPKIQKCTLCQPRIIHGLKPACVDACPKEALTFGVREDLINLARQQIFTHPGEYLNHIYGEHEMGGTNWIYISPVPFADIGMREDLGTLSAPNLTSGPLAMVPVVVSLWIVFLTGIHAMTKRKEAIATREKDEAVVSTRREMLAEMERQITQLKQKAQEEREAAIKKEVKKALDDAAKQPAHAPKPEVAATTIQESNDPEKGDE
jgi:formate dehydrogenase iron-sulfur subunit